MLYWPPVLCDPAGNSPGSRVLNGAAVPDLVFVPVAVRFIVLWLGRGSFSVAISNRVLPVILSIRKSAEIIPFRLSA